MISPHGKLDPSWTLLPLQDMALPDQASAQPRAPASVLNVPLLTKDAWLDEAMKTQSTAG